MYNLTFIKKVLQKRKQLSLRKLADKYDLSVQAIQNWEKGKLPKEAAGHIVEFLPAYSPDLTPIEHKWAQKKAFRRKHRCSVEECYM